MFHEHISSFFNEMNEIFLIYYLIDFGEIFFILMLAVAPKIKSWRAFLYHFWLHERGSKKKIRPILEHYFS